MSFRPAPTGRRWSRWAGAGLFGLVLVAPPPLSAGYEEMRSRQQCRELVARIERNGNGRDFDVVPSIAGGQGSGHRFRLGAIGAEIRQQIPDFALGRPYTLRATLVLDIGHGGPAGYWSDAFVESVLPARERTPVDGEGGPIPTRAPPWVLPRGRVAGSPRNR